MVWLHLLLGPLILFIALLVKRYAPKEPNPYYGYRTKSSKRNQTTWEFANRYSSNLMIKIAIAIIGIQLLTLIFFSLDIGILISTLALVVGVIAISPITESQMKKRFDEVGNLRLPGDKNQ